MTRGGIATYNAIVGPATSERYLLAEDVISRSLR
jgi:hypothetical protein